MNYWCEYIRDAFIHDMGLYTERLAEFAVLPYQQQILYSEKITCLQNQHRISEHLCGHHFTVS